MADHNTSRRIGVGRAEKRAKKMQRQEEARGTPLHTVRIRSVMFRCSLHNLVPSSLVSAEKWDQGALFVVCAEPTRGPRTAVSSSVMSDDRSQRLSRNEETISEPSSRLRFINNTRLTVVNYRWQIFIFSPQRLMSTQDKEVM